MNKCFIVTTLLLVCLIAVLESLVSYQCEKDGEHYDYDPDNPDLGLELPSDISDTTSTKQYLCNNTKNVNVHTLVCNAWKQSSPTTYSASSTTEKENGKEAQKCYTLTVIILVALGCLLMGVLVTTLVFVLYMKRRLRVCFSKHIKEVQGDSKQQSGPHLQFLNESGLVKTYDPNSPKSADLKNKNKAEESQYESVSSNKVGNDQQIYDQLNVNESGPDRHGHQPIYSRLQHPGNDYQIC